MNLDVNSAISIAGETASSLYAAVPMKVILLVISLVFCFAGYRLLRWVSAMYGVVIGVALGACVTSLFSASAPQAVNLVLTVLAMVLLGLLFAGICFRFTQAGVFLLCACIGAAVGYVPAMFVMQHSAGAFWGILAVCAVLFGVTGVLFLRTVGIVSTSFFGFGAAFPLLALCGVQQIWLAVAVGLGLTAAGCVVQTMLNRDGAARPFAFRKKPDAADCDPLAEERIPDETDAHLRAAAPEEDMTDDCTQVLDVRDVLEQQEPDEIDSISNRVAEHIGMTDPRGTQPMDTLRTEPLTAQTYAPAAPNPDETVVFSDQPAGISDDPEEVDDSTMLLTLKDTPAPEPPQAEKQQESSFAWLDEISVESEPEKPADNIRLWNEDGAGADTIARNIWGAQAQPDRMPEPDDCPAEQPCAEETQREESAPAEDTSDAEPAAEPEPEGGMWEELQTVFFAPGEDDSPAADDSEQPAEEAPKAEPEPERSAEPEPEAEPDAPAEESEPETSEELSGPVAAILLVAFTLVSAVIGVQYAALTMALCFVCYLQHRYRVVAFSCAVLCVRGAVDVVLMVLRGNSTLSALMAAVSCAVFLALTATAIRALVGQKQQGDDE